MVTGVVTANDWGLAIAGQPGARLDMSAALGGNDSYALLRHGTARAEQAQGVAAFERSQEGQAAHFFKARKLVISDAMHDHYLANCSPNLSIFGHPTSVIGSMRRC